MFRCLSTTEVYFCARPGPVPSEESLPQPTTALSLSMRSQPPPCGAVGRYLSPPLRAICRPRLSGLGILVVLRAFTVWKGSGLVSSHGVCVLLFGARTGKGLCAGVERGGDVLCVAGRVWSVTALNDSNGMPDTPSQARVGEDKLSHNSKPDRTFNRTQTVSHRYSTQLP